jgi:hypothetical protein
LEEVVLASTMTCQSDSYDSNLTTIDEDGDLILVVGEAKRRLLVASKALTMASKVFKAILSRNFRDAQELADR